MLELVCKKSGDGSLQGELPLEADLRDGFQSDLSNIGVVACDKKERKPLIRKLSLRSQASHRKLTPPPAGRYFTTQCGPCRALAPILDELATEFEGKLTFVKLIAIADALATQTCADLGVRSVPTLLIFQNGVEKLRRTGAASKTELHAWIESALYL